MIEFPGLWGLKFTINPVAVSFGNISIYWYGVIIALAFLLAVLLGMKDSKKFGIDTESIIDLVLIGAPVAIIFARLFYVVFSWENFKDDPIEIFRTWHGGLAFYGGLIGSVLVVLLFSKARKIKLFKLLDFVAPYIVMAQGIGRWGNFINQEAFGVNTSLPWGMKGDQISSQLSYLQMQGINVDPNLPVHPAFLYESLWDIAVFILLIFYRKRKKIDGQVFSLYMILYGLGRVWIEGLRTDSLMLGNSRISQILSVLFIITFTILFFVLRGKVKEAEIEAETGPSEYNGVLKKLIDEEQQEATLIENAEVNENTRDGEAALQEEDSQPEEPDEAARSDSEKEDDVKESVEEPVEESVEESVEEDPTASCDETKNPTE